MITWGISRSDEICKKKKKKKKKNQVDMLEIYIYI